MPDTSDERRARGGHVTSLHSDGFKYYFTCAAGDVTHTSNAFSTQEHARAAATAHEHTFAAEAEQDGI